MNTMDMDRTSVSFYPASQVFEDFEWVFERLADSDMTWGNAAHTLVTWEFLLSCLDLDIDDPIDSALSYELESRLEPYGFEDATLVDMET